MILFSTTIVSIAFIVMLYLSFKVLDMIEEAKNEYRKLDSRLTALEQDRNNQWN